MRKTLLSAVAASTVMAGAPLHAAVTFVFNYTDVGVGFDDPIEGAARQAALEASADVVEALFTNYTATINIDANGGETDDNTLASAGSNFNGPFGPGFGNQGDVQIKILGGVDPSGGADGIVNWNFEDHMWELGTDFQPGEFDFVSTAIHELIHAVGFSSDILQNGNDFAGNTPGNPGNWAPFDEFVADSTGSIINSTTFSLDGARWNAASVGGTSPTGLFFNGPNASAANGGNPVPLYSPNPWEGGSSGSHTDDQWFNGTTAAPLVMNATANTGLGIRTLSAIEEGILRDIGYLNLTVAAVPEASESTLAILAATGLLTARRRRRAEQAQS